MIIDEINRANLGKVFGEIMMLIEADKRGEQFSLPLTYSETADERFWIPHNLHMIGTMNTADRSLALVDFALRRRFLFVTLAPEFGDRFRKALQVQGVPVNMIDRIIQRVTTLNQSIISEKDLGPGFQVGHSFFSTFVKGEDVEAWYHRVIEHEIRPLLHEYWFDSPKKADDEIQKLLL
jgi:5-methylcytosine-specific restriction protein B